MGRTAPSSLARGLGLALIAAGFRGNPCATADVEAIRPALRATLDASGLTAADRSAYEGRFEALAADVAARIGSVRSPERRARKLHRILHDRVFARYRDDADGVPEVLDRGDFNCVSATLVEGLLARAIGLQPWIIPGSRHLFLRVEFRSRTIDVETTAPDGFDARGGSDALKRILVAYKLATAEEIAARGDRAVVDRYERFGPAVPLEAGAAFVWYNAAERALGRGEGRRAAERILAGETLYPGIAATRPLLQTAIGRAFRSDYDAGRFDDAYATAAIGVRLDRGLVSAQDRLIAAAAQRVEGYADAGSVARAEAVVSDVERLLGNDSQRFERQVLPLVVAAAVRVGEWGRAAVLADRFTAVELDAVESGRLRAWVRSRRDQATAPR